MSITIAERLRPFSHRPGVKVLVPGSSYSLQIFPAYLKIADLRQAQASTLAEWQLSIEGPVDQFTVLQDLEKRKISVWGQAQNGYFRYHCYLTENRQEIVLEVEKASPAGLTYQSSGNKELQGNLDAKQLLTLFTFATPCMATSSLTERLSLGNHKAQEWELIRRRSSMIEVFPLWHRLGLLTSTPLLASDEETEEGTLKLVKKCQEAIHLGKPETIVPAFTQLFLAGFDEMLMPRLTDSEYRGYSLTSLSQNYIASALTLLTMGSSLIRQLFFQQKKETYELDTYRILPHLPPEFFCGRLLNIPCSKGLLDLEWTKKTMRRLIFKSHTAGTLRFDFQKGVKSFRLKRALGDRGQRYPVHTPLTVESNECLYLDNFMY